MGQMWSMGQLHIRLCCLWGLFLLKCVCEENNFIIVSWTAGRLKIHAAILLMERFWSKLHLEHSFASLLPYSVVSGKNRGVIGTVINGSAKAVAAQRALNPAVGGSLYPGPVHHPISLCTRCDTRLFSELHTALRTKCSKAFAHAISSICSV